VSENGEAAGAAPPADEPALESALEVWIDHDLCTGDGLCVEYAREVFELDLDGVAYVKDEAGTLLDDANARAAVPPGLRLEVIDSARECPGACIHVARRADGVEIAGPAAS
jgi:ferredoxin